MATSQIEQQVMLRLSSAEVRYTKGRRLLLQALQQSDGPRSARDLHKDLEEEVPMSSIYRTLTTMSDLGILVPHHGTGGNIRYELAEWLVGHHHHLTCRSCGNIDDIELTGHTESIIDSLVSAATKEKGFTAAGHSFEIHGVCASCADAGSNTG
ncbi:MAG: Fur family transcriptional regulator [bacterium]|nr:Fur family transcriptional regulator [bacterium]MDE0352598.1 Fur family transcriptional regulator [bacterium]